VAEVVDCDMFSDFAKFVSDFLHSIEPSIQPIGCPLSAITRGKYRVRLLFSSRESFKNLYHFVIQGNVTGLLCSLRLGCLMLSQDNLSSAPQKIPDSHTAKLTRPCPSVKIALQHF